MLFAKCEYDCDMIIDKCPGFYDLKEQQKIHLFMKSSIKL